MNNNVEAIFPLPSMQDPLPGARIYRTGDLACWPADALDRAAVPAL